MSIILEELKKENAELQQKIDEEEELAKLKENNRKLKLMTGLIKPGENKTVENKKTNSHLSENYLIPGGILIALLGLFSPWNGGTILTIGAVLAGLGYLRKEHKL